MNAGAQASRLGIGIVGAGRVGPVLARALAGAGHAIVAIHASGEEGRERAESMLPGVPQLEVAEVVRRSELVLFAVPGSELPDLVAGLAATGAWQPGQLAIHTAPEHGIGVFAPALAAGVIPLALHPAMVFTGTSLDLTRLAEATVAVTAPAPVLPIGQALAVELGCEPVVIAEKDRPAYAEAIATASEFARSIVGQATGLLRGIGVENPGGYLSALVSSTFDRALREVTPAQFLLPDED